MTPDVLNNMPSCSTWLYFLLATQLYGVILGNYTIFLALLGQETLEGKCLGENRIILLFLRENQQMSLNEKCSWCRRMHQWWAYLPFLMTTASPHHHQHSVQHQDLQETIPFAKGQTLVALSFWNEAEKTISKLFTTLFSDSFCLSFQEERFAFIVTIL